MITFEEAVSKLKSGLILELKFTLNFGFYSRHELSLERGVLTDYSFVDGSSTPYSVKDYKNSFYGRAFELKVVELLEER